MPSLSFPSKSELNAVIKKRKPVISAPRPSDRLFVISHPDYRYALTFVQEKLAWLLPPSADVIRESGGTLRLGSSLGVARGNLAGVQEYDIPLLAALFSVFLSCHEETIRKYHEEEGFCDYLGRFSVTFPIRAFFQFLGAKSHVSDAQITAKTKKIESFGALYGIIFDKDDPRRYEIFDVLADYTYDETSHLITFRSPYMARIIYQFFANPNYRAAGSAGPAPALNKGDDPLPNYTDIVRSSICLEKNKPAVELALYVVVTIVRLGTRDSVNPRLRTFVSRSPQLNQSLDECGSSEKSIVFSRAFDGLWEICKGYPESELIEWGSYRGVELPEKIPNHSDYLNNEKIALRKKSPLFGMFSLRTS